MLFNQFKYFFNLYFLLLACSQFVNEFRLGALYTYWVPLVCEHCYYQIQKVDFTKCVLLMHVELKTDATLTALSQRSVTYITVVYLEKTTSYILFHSPGPCFDYYHYERGHRRNKMLPQRQRSELSDLQQAFNKR